MAPTHSKAYRRRYPEPTKALVDAITKHWPNARHVKDLPEFSKKGNPNFNDEFMVAAGLFEVLDFINRQGEQQRVTTLAEFESGQMIPLHPIDYTNRPAGSVAIITDENGEIIFF